MALVLKDRVKETTTTTGTGTITLAGASSGFQSFSSIGNGNTTYYTIAGGTEWEVGLGTYTSSGNTLSRDTVLESSNGGSLVNFSAGTKDIFVTYPAEKSVTSDGILSVSIGGTGTSTAFTTGSVVFTGASGTYSQDNANFFWDNTNNRLGIGTTTPTNKLTVNGGIDFSGTAFSGSGTGIWQQATNVLGFVTAGSTRAVIDATGNVGIGTTSPSSFAKLAIVGTTATNLLQMATAGNTSGLYMIPNDGGQFTLNSYGSGLTINSTTSTGVVTVGTNNTERMRIDSSGNVGIGTSSPTNPLTVSATSARNAPLATIQSTGVFGGGGNNDVGLVVDISAFASSTSALNVKSASTSRLWVGTDGNVGIGTSSPGAALGVGNGTDQAQLAGGLSGTTSVLYLGSPNNGSGGQATLSYVRSTGITSLGSSTTGGALGSAFNIDNSGNVGIGTSSPTQMLTVNGAVGYNAPITVTDATHTVATTTNWIIANRAGTVTLTLPAAASFTGRILTVKNVQAQTVISASSDVVPIGSTSAGTAILSATAGKFATIVSDGTNWIVMQAN